VFYDILHVSVIQRLDGRIKTRKAEDYHFFHAGNTYCKSNKPLLKLYFILLKKKKKSLSYTGLAYWSKLHPSQTQHTQLLFFLFEFFFLFFGFFLFGFFWGGGHQQELRNWYF